MDPEDRTEELVELIRNGDHAAEDRLFCRYSPILRRWAAGRLPRQVRGSDDTNDIVQETLLRALIRLRDGKFEYRREAAFLFYLRRIAMNQILTRVRRNGRRPELVTLPEGHPTKDPSPLDRVVGQDTLERVEKALPELTRKQCEAVVLWSEMDFSWPRIAAALTNRKGKPVTEDAARMLVSRGLAKLARILGDDGPEREPGNERP